MEVETLVVGQLATNCYLVWCPKTSEAIIIDPGDAGDYIGEKILALKLKPKLIVATHGHFDHILAATELKLAFNIPFLIHKQDESLLKRSQRTARYFTGIEVDPSSKIDRFIEEGEVIKFGKETLKVIETPGHTPGSVCFYSKGVLFSGDTLFAGGVGRTDLGGGSQDKLLKSIKTKLFVLAEKTVVYPGHGERTIIGKEKQYYSGCQNFESGVRWKY